MSQLGVLEYESDGGESESDYVESGIAWLACCILNRSMSCELSLRETLCSWAQAVQAANLIRVKRLGPALSHSLLF